MRWFNHILIAAAPTALIAPRLVPVAILGATAPDWLEWLAKLARQPLPHRGPTHWVAAWLVGLVAGVLLPDPAAGIVVAFAWGGLSHVLADSLTVSGVPFSPASERRFHLMGGRLRTGGAGEYGVSWGVVLTCWACLARSPPLAAGSCHFSRTGRSATRLGQPRRRNGGITAFVSSEQQSWRLRPADAIGPAPTHFRA